MYETKGLNTKLLSLMKEALSVCTMLYDYSFEKMNHLDLLSDEEVLQTIQEREPFLNQLINLEYQIYDILDASDIELNNIKLPDDVENVRQTVRQVLNEIDKIDDQAINCLSDKIQIYKNDALKARNKKNLSAYIQSSNWVSR